MPEGRILRDLYDPKGDASLKALKLALYADRTMIEPTRHLAAAMTGAGQPALLHRDEKRVDSNYRRINR